MKAMVLAAGEGRRLRPLTTAVPKPMIAIVGRPILEHTVESLVRQGVRELVINLHHCSDSVRAHFGDGSRWGARIRYSPEPTLRGTAGALTPWREFFDASFLVVYGDNLTSCNLASLEGVHRARRAFATMALFHRADPSQSGVAEVEPDGRIRRFLEKPGAGAVFSHWVNAGVMILEPEAIDTIPRDRPADFGRDLLPRWVAEGRQVFGYLMPADEKLWWIDTPEDLRRVESEFAGEAVR